MELWVPLLAAVSGGIGAQLLGQILRTWRHRREGEAEVAVAEIAGAAQLRAELWRELENLRGELQAERDRVGTVMARLEETRRQYLDVLDRHAALAAEHMTLKVEHAELQEKNEQVQRQMQVLREQQAATG